MGRLLLERPVHGYHMFLNNKNTTSLGAGSEGSEVERGRQDYIYFVRSGYTVKMLIIVIINTQQLFPDKKHQEKEMFQCKGVTL